MDKKKQESQTAIFVGKTYTIPVTRAIGIFAGGLIGAFAVGVYSTVTYIPHIINTVTRNESRIEALEQTTTPTKELDIKLKNITDDISEIKSDVKTLLHREQGGAKVSSNVVQ